MISACPQCGSGVHLKSPHFLIEGTAVRVYCSSACRADATAEVPAIPEATPRLHPAGRWLAIGLGLASLSPIGGAAQSFRSAATPIAEAIVPAPPPLHIETLPVYGPNPPTETDLAQQFAASLADDRWVHPLAGPARRMPIRSSRVFGADRPGDRPLECGSGHCGVDIGETWGEPVFAVNDGVVERVERRAKKSGGRYVRIGHRDGALVTYYFHLAAIPRRLAPGVVVETGEIIGIVGESGVEQSGPHLHFGVSVRPDPESKREVFVDPEPLVALWPLKLPMVNGVAQVSVVPGVPRGASGTRKLRPRRRASLDASGQVTPAPGN